MKNSIVETFMNVQGYFLSQVIQKEPSSFNGEVRVEKYRVTVEKIEESWEVYQERLQVLWDVCENHHQWTPIKRKAKELGVELKGEPGSKKNSEYATHIKHCSENACKYGEKDCPVAK